MTWFTFQAKPSIIEGVRAEKRSRNKDHTTLSEVWGVQHSSATASCNTERGKVRKKPLLSGALGLGLLQPARAAPGLGRNWETLGPLCERFGD